MPPLPAPARWAGPLPVADPPGAMTIYQLPTGTYDTRAALAVQGGSLRDVRHFAATAVLVRHPKGDVLIDAGFGSQIAEQVAMLPRLERARYHVGATARAQLDASGYDRRRLLGVLVTHAHWDHVSGLGDLGVPVWITREELRYAGQDKHGAVFRSLAPGLRIHEYTLDGPPYLGFAASHDVHGDGSVVVAHAGGHTFGSVVVFVALPGGRRYAFIGDVAWQLDGIRRRVERPWLMRRLADTDAEGVRQGLLRLIALEELMSIVPAHDVDAFTGIPLVPDRFHPSDPGPGSTDG